MSGASATHLHSNGSISCVKEVPNAVASGTLEILQIPVNINAKFNVNHYK